MTFTEPAAPLFLSAPEIARAIPHIDTRAALADMFSALKNGSAIQPPQTLAPFPGRAGDVIAYMGVLSASRVFGTKLSPYIVTAGAPLVTAWTLLMSMETGQPLMLCDAGQLTIERTAATTALAVELLARPGAARLAVIGAGPVALAHLRHVQSLRDWESISVYAPRLQHDRAAREALRATAPRATLAGDAASCVHEADVVMLCTSSGTPVVKPADFGKPALITSISTNVARAHEIEPAMLREMDVYCDYRRTTPAIAGEMTLATELHGWQDDQLCGDLPELVERACATPAYGRHVFFRSVGLGLEDVAIANALFHHCRSGR